MNFMGGKIIDIQSNNEQLLDSRFPKSIYNN